MWGDLAIGAWVGLLQAPLKVYCYRNTALLPMCTETMVTLSAPNIGTDTDVYRDMGARTAAENQQI